MSVCIERLAAAVNGEGEHLGGFARNGIRGTIPPAALL